MPHDLDATDPVCEFIAHLFDFIDFNRFENLDHIMGNAFEALHLCSNKEFTTLSA